MGDKIPDDVLNALVENTKELNAKLPPLTDEITQKGKEELKNDNVVKEDEVKPSLTTTEKARYASIGKEMMTPFLKSLKSLIAAERKRNEMIIKDKADTVETEAKVQYGEEEKSEFSWVKILLPIILAIGAAIYFFKEETVKFFKEAWDWTKEKFKEVADFFENIWENSTVKEVLNAIKDGIVQYWEKIKGEFVDIAKKLWSYAEPIWNSFIDTMKSWWEAIKETWNSFMAKFDEFYESVKSAIRSVTDTMSNIVSWIKENLTGMGLIGKLFSSDEESKEEKPKEQKAVEPAKAAAQQNVELLTDSLKNSVASSIVDDLSKKIKDGEISPEEAEKYKKFLKEQISVNNGEISVDFEAARKKMLEEASKDGTNSKFITQLQEMKDEGAAVYSKELNEDLNKDQGLAEVHNTILESAQLIKEAFSGYDEQIRKNFTETWSSFVSGFLTRNSYTITPLHKESFDAMSNALIRLAQESVDIITKQNAVLDDIKELLAQPPPAPANPATANISVGASNAGNGLHNAVAMGAKKFAGNLWTASSHWT